MCGRQYSSALKEGFRLVYKDIQEQVLRNIQDELTKSYGCQSMDWNWIKRNLEKLPTARVYRSNNMFWNFFRLLMDIFDSYKIGDLPFVDDVLQCASFATFFDDDDLSIFPSEKELRVWFHQRGIRYRSTNLHMFVRADDVMRMFPMNLAEDIRNSSINFLRRIPYAWRSHLRRNEEKHTDCYLHILWKLTTQGEEYLCSILLKYGVLYLGPTKYRQKYMDYILVMLRKRERLHVQGEIPFRLESSQFSPRILDVLGGVRIIAEIMHFKRLNCPASPAAVVACFRKIYDSIPEPFINVQEVREALEKIVWRDPEKFDSSMVEPMCEEFQNIFPESTGPRTPRSLKHLCRCQVREGLRKVAGLPHKVSLLPLPMSLQKYINLDLYE